MAFYVAAFAGAFAFAGWFALGEAGAVAFFFEVVEAGFAAFARGGFFDLGQPARRVKAVGLFGEAAGLRERFAVD